MCVCVRACACVDSHEVTTTWYSKSEKNKVPNKIKLSLSPHTHTQKLSSCIASQFILLIHANAYKTSIKPTGLPRLLGNQKNKRLQIYILSEQTNYEDQTVPAHPSAWSARASKTEQTGHGPTVLLTPSLPQPVKCLGWKVHAHLPPDSIFGGPITNLFSISSILIEILFMYSRKGVQKLECF